MIGSDSINFGKVFAAPRFVLLSNSESGQYHRQLEHRVYHTLQNFREGTLIDLVELQMLKNADVDLYELLESFMAGFQFE